MKLLKSIIPELHFDKDLLSIHLNSPVYLTQKRIYTVRSEVKGDPGDIFLINGVGFFVLEEVSGLDVYSHWYLEGFSSRDEFDKALQKIYGHNRCLWCHELLKTNLEVEYL